MHDRAVLVLDIADARAALAAASALEVSVTLVSAPSAAAALGPGWWRAAIDLAGAEYPNTGCTAILDCGARADLIQAALRIGLRDLCFRGSSAVARKLAEVAAQHGARLHTRPREPLDLSGVPDREAACRAWLSERGRRPGPG